MITILQAYFDSVNNKYIYKNIYANNLEHYYKSIKQDAIKRTETDTVKFDKDYKSLD